MVFLVGVAASVCVRRDECKAKDECKLKMAYSLATLRGCEIMTYRLLANLTALLHAGFVLFVIAGGLLAYRWPGVLWWHGPVAVYGVLIMVFHWRCPLTDLEINLRRAAGETVEWAGFLERYLFSRLGIKDTDGFVLAGLVALMLLCNSGIYWRILFAD